MKFVVTFKTGDGKQQSKFVNGDCISSVLDFAIKNFVTQEEPIPPKPEKMYFFKEEGFFGKNRFTTEEYRNWIKEKSKIELNNKNRLVRVISIQEFAFQ